MNIVHAGNNYQIYSDALKVYSKLPKGVYDITFNKMSGFSLIDHSSLEVKEEKIYGDTEKKIQKVLRGFAASNRNFGVILSGNKGIGKSLFARLLSIEAQKRDLPVILVNEYIPGIASFLQTIQQEVVVFFDEFEKTFAEGEDSNPQEEMLSLFDGVDNGKKLFVITCNEISRINDFYLNRPGRFHYHFTLSSPTPIDITEYMTDKLGTGFDKEISKVISLSYCTNITYDILRAICFELQLGYGLTETLADLNISKDSAKMFKIHIELSDGTYAEGECRVQLTNAAPQSYWLYDTKRRSCVVRFSGLNTVIDTTNNCLCVKVEDCTFAFETGEDYSEDEAKLISCVLLPVSLGTDKFLI